MSVLLVILLSLVSAISVYAAVPTCAITGTLVNVDGTPAAKQNVTFQVGAVQNTSGVIVPSGQQIMVQTDSNGNLPTNGCRPTGSQFCPPQGAIFFTQIGNGPVVKMQAPLSTSADLNTLMLANSDPPSLVTNLVSGNSNCSIVNPAPGTFGQATLTCSGGSSISQAGVLAATNNLSDVQNTVTAWKNLNAGQVALCTITGTSGGSAQCYQVQTGQTKTTTCYFTGYLNTTATPQTCSLTANNGSACTQSATTSSNTEPYAVIPTGSPVNSLNLPSNMSANPAPLTQIFQQECI